MVQILENWINNKSVSVNGKSLPVTSPSSGEVIAHGPLTTLVEEAVQSCQKAFEAWR